jgi:hypothetical protein
MGSRDQAKRQRTGAQRGSKIRRRRRWRERGRIQVRQTGGLVMEKATRYLCRVRLQDKERVVLWETSDAGPDRIVVDDVGSVVSFESELEAIEHSAQSVSTEGVTRYDLDALRTWCVSGDLAVDCSKVLNAWNFLGDLPREHDLFAGADSRAETIYAKLFHGCNLPAMGANPGQYSPIWTSSEIAALKLLLVLGINDFWSRCRSWQAVEQGVAAGVASPRT